MHTGSPQEKVTLARWVRTHTSSSENNPRRQQAEPEVSVRTNLRRRLSVFIVVGSKTLKFQQSAGHPKLFPSIEVSNTSGTGKHQAGPGPI